MSNKSKINELDTALRGTYRTGMLDGTRVVIRMVSGFELFNTRPYHNYENWAQGYEATDGRVFATAEDLDDCIALLTRRAAMSDEELKREGGRLTPEMVASFAQACGRFVGTPNAEIRGGGSVVAGDGHETP